MSFVLLLVFALGGRAQNVEYVIFYDVVTEYSIVRHYVSINEGGTAVVDETTFSDRCVWIASTELPVALGEWGVSLSGKDAGTYNNSNRKTLQSKAEKNSYLCGPVESYQTSSQKGIPVDLSLRTNGTRTFWLLDKDYSGFPVYSAYYHNHYVFLDEGTWKFSSGVGVGVRPERARIAKLEVLPLIPVSFTWDVSNDKPTVSMVADAGCDIRYTLDGTAPTTESVSYTGPIQVDWNKAIKAIAVKDGKASSENELVLHRGETVSIDDREDHKWTYYSGVDASVDGGNYNTNYKGRIFNPNPRDVKITYDGNGGAVSIDNGEDESSFVYHKTLEQETTGNYTYTVISNPFSKRPAGKGFGGWKIISGGNYIEGHKDNDVLSLDENINFIDLPASDANNAPAEIKLQATWVNSNVSYATGGLINYEVSGGTYETNFMVLDKETAGTITVKSPCTIMMVEPDGSTDYRNDNTFTGAIIPMPDADGRTKIEFAKWNPAAAIDAMGRNFTIGRGMKMDERRALYGMGTANTPVNQVVKVESGKFASLTHYGANPQSITKQWITLGCDYDRAKKDNNKLEVTGRLLVGDQKKLGLSSDDEMCRVYGLSGKFMTNNTVSNANLADCYYMSVTGTANEGHRYLEILGGEWKSIAGGRGENHDEEKPSFTFRMRGGLLEGSVYGAAEYRNASGTRTYIITGGIIKGWVAGGANGTNINEGAMTGASYIYVGGDAQINSEGSTTLINRAVGGNVFGAGCGYSANSTSGQVTLGTNVVIADNAYVERGVYGGGSYGYCPTDKTSNIYITGGTVDGIAGGVDGTKYMDNIQGGIYGGACQNIGGNVNIYMTGGTINGGIYGGSNASGTLSGNVNMTIAGGTVGTQEKSASLYGGGFGNNTTVSGNVNIKYTGGLLNGNLFGGGNEGVVNGNTSVTITGGEIKQNVYGGGNKAAVSGTTNVVIGKQ